MKKDTGWAIILCCLVILIVGYVIFASEARDLNCMQDIAKSYCEKNNLTYNQVYSQGFNCIKKYDPRVSKIGEYERFYFLENETNSCIKKERHSFGNFFSGITQEGKQ